MKRTIPARKRTNRAPKERREKPRSAGQCVWREPGIFTAL